MTIERASDNPFPSILIEESTEPTAPPAGHQRLYVDSTTHKLKRTDSTGTDVTVEGIAAGAITSSGLTQTTARLLGRTTASTGAVEEITVGTGLTLSAGSLTASGSAGVPQGTAFPGSPATNDHFCRTNLDNREYFYDGTRWRSVASLVITFPLTEVTHNFGTSAVNIGRLAIPYRGAHGLWIQAFDFFWNGGTYSGSVYWTIKLNGADASDSDTQVGSTMDTKLGTTGGNNYDVRQDIGAVLSTNARELKCRLDPVGGATQIAYASAFVTAQIIST